MFCEYCDTNLSDIAEARRHMLTIDHVRNRNSYDLNTAKFFERYRQAKLHPDNFQKLCQTLNMHSDKDVIALEKNGFFKMDKLWHYDVSDQLLKVLQDSGIDYHMNRLHPQVRQKLLEALDEAKVNKAP